MAEDALNPVPPGFPRRILLVHNRYKLAGGEDSVYQSERDLLARMGHEVDAIEFANAETDRLPKWKAAVEAVWSAPAKAAIADRIRAFRPDVVHFHNTFLRVSPAAYYACAEAGVPCVQTLHNYRLLCVNALFLRDGTPCEDCLGRTLPWPGVYHRCYHGSLADSCLAASVRKAHDLLGTYERKVGAFIALTSFGKGKFIQGGLPAEKIHVKPNFVEDLGGGTHAGDFCLFAGRLSHEKGVETLVRAWERMDGSLPLKIVGSGPMESLMARLPAGVEYLGRRPREEVFALMRDATLAIVPSGCYEGFPVAIAEAFSAGLPVIASRLGTMEEILRDGNAGWLCAPGDAADLAATVTRAFRDPAALQEKGRGARSEFLSKYGPEANYAMLMRIYAAAAAR